MAETSTFIKIDRNIQSWRWYQDANTLQMFIHLIINANVSEASFQTIVVQRGQLVTSQDHLAKDLGTSRQSVRTALKHLISTNEITIKSYPKFSVITVVNYDRYQRKQPSNQPATNQQLTSNQPQYKKDITNVISKNERSKEDIFADFAQGDEVLLDALQKFEKMRKDIRKPLSADAKNLLLKKLQKFPHSQWVDVLEQSILNSWQGLYPLDKEKGGKKGTYTLKNGIQTTNPFLAIYDEEFNNDERRNSKDTVIIESSVS